jgi:TPR repeat protein
MKAGMHALGILLLMTLIVAAMCTTAIAAEPEFDASTSITQLESLASGGNAAAMLEYGERLVQGQGADSNTAQGLSWLQKAADAGKSEAWYDIGFVYSNGVGVELDVPKAVTYYRKGAEAGNADCQASMGLLYQAGDKVPSGLTADPAEAVKWYRLASDQNHTEAIQHLAMMNAMGNGIKQDNAEAARLFRQGAELGNADCTWGLGQCYLSGKGVQPDTVMAYALFSASLDGVENPEQKKAMTEQCDKLGKALTAVQLTMAEPLILECKAKGRMVK